MEKETNRKCIATGQIKSKEELLRFVKTPDSRLVPDFNKKLEGRGLYVSVSKKALQTALDKNLFIKSIRQHLKIEDNFLSLVEQLLYKRGLDSVNLARKAGALVTGFEKVKEKILKNKVAFLIEAQDAGQDGTEKICAIAKNLEVIKVYNIQDLDLALDKVNTVHVAVLKSDIAGMVYKNVKRYQTFLD
ncbi:MAG: DUF448 domain-containing protein [Alphaproteobacteria bacterium]|nr:DUF448 domain-containing protein [Alphaproteobacteria bacterium]MBQ2811157.1 DUF448 domain-containing protein [Alphaproteobacteria bacterium]